MGALYLTELAAWLSAAGLTVLEYSGWQTRARSSGGYEQGRPWAVVWHHTASESSPETDAAYIADGDEDAPLANLLIDRTGTVWVIAAGATNTNGKGGPWTVSHGTVPADQMNTHAVAMEIANSGTGETYPAEQITAAFTVSLTLCDRLGLAATDALEHVEWAPDRKVDPATADAATGFWPHSINNSGSWSGDDLRAELAARAGHPTPPPQPDPTPPKPPLEEDDMQTYTAAYDANETVWIGDGKDRWTPSEAEVSNMIVLANAGSWRLINGNGKPVRNFGDITTFGPDTIAALGRPR